MGGEGRRHSRGGPGGDPLHRPCAQVRRRVAHGGGPPAPTRLAHAHAHAQRLRPQGQRGASPAHPPRHCGLITRKERMRWPNPEPHLSAPVRKATRATGEPPFPADRAFCRGSTGAGHAGIARRSEMDISLQADSDAHYCTDVTDVVWFLWKLGEVCFAFPDWIAGLDSLDWSGVEWSCCSL